MVDIREDPTRKSYAKGPQRKLAVVQMDASARQLTYDASNVQVWVNPSPVGYRCESKP